MGTKDACNSHKVVMGESSEGKLLEELFDKALRDTNQLRYIIAFPKVCTEFLRSTSPFAPEECCFKRPNLLTLREIGPSQVIILHELQNLAELIGPYGLHYMGEKLMELVAAQVAEIKKLVIANQDTLIALYSSRDKSEIFNKLLKRGGGEMSVNTVNFFLELIAKESKSVMGVLCEERVLQDEELAPSNGAAYYFKEHPDKLKKKGKNTQLALVSPGKESLRKVVDETSTKDLMLRNLVDLCFSLNCFPSILVWDHSFVPRQYLVSHLEDLLMKNIVSMMKHNPVTFEIDHPSTVLRRIRSYISCLRSLELYDSKSKDDLALWNWFLMFVGVTLPSLAMTPQSNFISVIEAHENNAHCLAVAVNALAGAIFAYFGPEEQKQKMKDFLIFTSSHIMTLAKEVEKERDAPKAREATYILLDLVDGRGVPIPYPRPAGVVLSLLSAPRLIQLCVPKTTSFKEAGL
eukprot:Em0006g1415a